MNKVYSGSTLIELADAHHSQAVDVLTEAYLNDPFFKYVCGFNKKNDRKKPFLLAQVFYNSYIQRGISAIGFMDKENLVGVGIVSEPKNKISSLPLLIELIRMLLFGQFGITFRILIYLISTFNDRVDTKKYYDLRLLAVDTGYRKHGYASILIAHIENRSKEHSESQGIILSTHNPENLPIYEHLGFSIIKEYCFKDIKIWYLAKEL